MKGFFFFFILVAASGCTSFPENSQRVIDEVISVAGGDHYNNTEVQFQFRDREYGYKKHGGQFEYVRLFKDSMKVVRDVLTNDGFMREIDGVKVDVVDSMARKYSNSINSVIYFALLPNGLNDAAVNKTYLGKKTIKGKEYHKIMITFDEAGGGDDFEDVFIYWVNTADQKIDYLAYEFHVDGGGMRFREAYNERYIGNIRFVDHINYKPSPGLSLENIDDAYMSGALEELSKIELKQIKVNQL